MSIAAPRISGAIYGVLVADALGGPVQFKKRGTFAPVTDLRPVEPFHKPTGAWSDDGSMTLCIAQSLVENNGIFSARDIAAKFHRWYAHGSFISAGKESWDVGNATGIACQMWAKILGNVHGGAAGQVGTLPSRDEFRTVQKAIYESKHLSSPKCQGNGSLMRVAPIGVLFHHDTDAAMRYARAQSDLTHPHPACGDACAVYTRLIAECFKFKHLGTHSPEEQTAQKRMLARIFSNMDISDLGLRERLHSRCYPESEHPLVRWNKVHADQVHCEGWVVDTLDAALWAFFTTRSWEEGALRVVNLGGDSDSAGAVYGGLAGAFYGFDAIPEKWKKGILKPDMVHGITKNLVEVAKA